MYADALDLLQEEHAVDEVRAAAPAKLAVAPAVAVAPEAEPVQMPMRSVALASDGATTGEAIATGSCARITNLKARPELNGKLALVHSFNESSGRWNVAVLDGPNGSGGTTLALKPSALALETPEMQ